MADTANHLDVRPFLPHALAATAGVVLVPLATMIVWLLAADPNPPLWIVALTGVVASAALSAAGSATWQRRADSADISFGELMIWGWLGRRAAERRLVEGASLLGLDRSGTPADQIRVDPRRQLQVLHELTEALEAKDPYTHGHSRRVERHVYRTALAMGLPVTSIEELRLAATLHDVGKIRVPDRILRKPGALTAEERKVIEEHSLVGGWMVSNVAGIDVVQAVRHHHERWDGSGYPDCLAGTEIPLYARIIAVADAYDAITSTRPYRAPSGRDDAVAAIRAETGVQFDPTVVESFVEALPRPATVAGLIVLLAGPRALWHQLAVVFKRTAAGSLAPAAAAVGAFVLLGSFVPGYFVPRPQGGPPAAGPTHVDGFEAQSSGGAASRHRPARAGERRNAGAGERRNARAGELRGSAGSGATAARVRGANEPPAASRPPRMPRGGSSPAGVALAPPAASPAPAPAATSSPQRGRDPQPGKGHDCDARWSDGHGDGRGHELHCGVP